MVKSVNEFVGKAVTRSPNSQFEMEDVTELVTKRKPSPKLLTSMFGGTFSDRFLQTSKFQYDEVTETLALPGGKAFDAHGPRLAKDVARMLAYNVGSFGLTYNTMPGDVANRRKPGGDQFLTTADVMSDLSLKAARAWDLFDELAIAKLITTDINVTRGAVEIPEYNFYNTTYGGARPAAINFDFANSTEDQVRDLVSIEQDEIDNEMEVIGGDSSDKVLICGKSIFSELASIEENASLARDLRSSLDLASMEIPKENLGGTSGGIFRYQNFFSERMGVWVIRYPASILGTKLIADDAAYMLPLGSSELFRRVYAPAQTEQYVNTTALPMYAEFEEHNRRGKTMATEKNVLFMSLAPKLIRTFTSTTFN